MSGAAPCYRGHTLGRRVRREPARLTGPADDPRDIRTSQPLLVVDLTGEVICQELADTARGAGVPVAAWPRGR
jgi:hypothetical protein